MSTRPESAIAHRNKFTGDGSRTEKGGGREINDKGTGKGGSNPPIPPPPTKSLKNH